MPKVRSKRALFVTECAAWRSKVKVKDITAPRPLYGAVGSGDPCRGFVQVKGLYRTAPWRFKMKLKEFLVRVEPARYNSAVASGDSKQKFV